MADGCSLRAKILGELMFQGARLVATTIDVHSEGQEAVLAYKRERRPIVFVGWHGHDAIHLSAHRILFGRSAPAVIMVLDDAAESTRDLAGPRSGMSTVGAGRSDDDYAPTPGLRRAGGGGRAPRAAARGQGGGRLDRAARQRRHRPSAAACSRQIELRNRWDKHLIPLPFSRTLVHFGTPIDSYPTVGPKPPLEDLRARLAVALQAGTARASAALGAREPENQPRAILRDR